MTVTRALLLGLHCIALSFAESIDRLSVGEQICTGGQLDSSSGKYSAFVQSDGNFVVYEVDTARVRFNAAAGSADGSDSETRCVVFQSDGNLVLYNEDRSEAFWASYAQPRTSGASAAEVVLEDNGRLVAYDSNGDDYWSSKPDRLYPDEPLCGRQYLESAPYGTYQAHMQEDGNFVVYSKGESPSDLTALWSTGTAVTDGSTPSRCVILQSGDGNLVMYEDQTTAVWASYRYSNIPQFLIMQADGNLVAYDTAGVAYWDSEGHTAGWALLLDWISSGSSNSLLAGLLVLLLVVNLVMMCCYGTKKRRVRYQRVKIVDSDIDPSEAEAINV